MTDVRKSGAKRISGRSALAVIALLFAASAVMRVASGPGQALAQEVAALRQGADQAAAPVQCSDSEDIDRVLAELSTRTAILDQRERELGEMESKLAFARKEIEGNLNALTQAEEKLAATMAQTETAAEKDLARLTSVYENMKPSQAAELFKQMAPEFAAGFMGRMRADAAAAIMAGLPPEMAYSISVILAGRNASAPTE